MTTTDDESPTSGGPDFSSVGDSGGGGTRSPTMLSRANFPSPWAQVVRGVGGAGSLSGAGESSSSPAMPDPVIANNRNPLPAQPAQSLDKSSGVESCEKSDVSNVGSGAKKTAWNKPSNGIPEESSSPVIAGDSSWPMLSKSHKSFQKSSGESSKSPVEVSKSVPVSLSQAPVISEPPPKPVYHASSSSTNNTAPIRQRPIKRGGGGNRQGGYNHPLPPAASGPPFPVTEMPLNAFGNVMPIISDTTPRLEIRPRGGVQAHLPQVNEHSMHRNSNRRGHFVQHGRGDVPHYGNYGVRRDQERGNYDWNSNPNLNVRDFHGQPLRSHGRSQMRPPPQGNVSYMPPQHVIRPSYGAPIVYHDSPPLVYMMAPDPSFRSVFVPSPSPPPFFGPYNNNSVLSLLVVNQIDYYFSEANLMTDGFLKSNMDDQGWVPIKLIADFPRVKCLVQDNIPFILESLTAASSILEVQGDRIRRRDDWGRWLLPNRSRTSLAAQPITLSGSIRLTPSFPKVSSDTTTNQDSMSMSGDPQSNVESDECLSQLTSCKLQVSEGNEVEQGTHSILS